MKAVIVAGGEGLRMRAVSGDVPKPMLPLRGRPILEHQLDWLREAGFKEATLCLGYRAQAVRAHFGDGARWGLALSYQIEAAPRGTAGCVRDLGPWGEDMLVVYGDLYLELDARAFLDFHAAHAGSATLVVRRTDHPQDSDLVELGEDGRVGAFLARGRPAPPEPWACAAVWAVRPVLRGRIPSGEPSDFARDVFPAALAAGEALWAYRAAERVLDLGTPERYARFVGEGA